MMNPFAGDRLIDGQFQIEMANHRPNRLRDNPRSARGTNGHDGPPVFQYDRRAHARQRAFARLN